MDNNQMLSIIAQVIQINYQKTSEFFINHNNYIPYIQEMQLKQVKPGSVNNINLQCTGHGSFIKNKVASRFIQNLQQVVKYNEEIKKVKIKLSGFDLSQQLDVNFMTRSKKSNKKKRPTLIQALTHILNQKVPILTSLQIRVCNVINCTFDDFKSIMELGVNRQARELVNLSCQFSDWSFPLLKNDQVGQKIYQINKQVFKQLPHDRNGQPNLDRFFNMLQQSFQGTVNEPLFLLKKFRLQISTWYYTDFEVQKFFHNVDLKGAQNLPKNDKIPLRIQYFHNEFKKKVSTLIKDLMPQLTNMQIDLRNWSKKFQMGILKGNMLNISNEKRTSLSHISRRYADNNKKLINNVLSHVQKSMMIRKTGNNQLAKIKEQVLNQNQEDKQKFFDLVVVV